MPWWKKNKEEKSKSKETDTDKPDAVQTTKTVFAAGGQVTEITTTTSTTVVKKRIQPVTGSVRFSKLSMPEFPGLSLPRNYALRFSDGQEHRVVTDVNTFRPPLTANTFEPSNYGLRPYNPVYQRTAQLSVSKPPEAPRQRSMSTSGAPTYGRPSTSTFQKTSVPSLTGEVKRSLLIVVKKSKTPARPQTPKVQLYKTTSRRRAYVFMINNVKYDDSKDYRKGAELDERNLTELFQQMDFKIDKHTNKKAAEMQKLIASHAKNSSLRHYDVSIVIVMGHGSGSNVQATNIHGIDHKSITIPSILDLFNSNNCPLMKDKPKIFIFQCCRGNMQPQVQSDAVQFTDTRLYSDMLIAYSTIPGYVSFRNVYSGSWYIEILCKIFMEHACDTDVQTMLQMIDHQLAEVKTENKRQTSNFENRGFNKDCYLNPGYYA